MSKETTTEVKSVDVMDANALKVLVSAGADSDFTAMLERSISRYREARVAANSAAQWSEDKAAEELWINSQDESASLYQELIDEINSLQAKADSIRSKAIAEYLEAAKDSEAPDEKDVKASLKTATRNVISAVTMSFDVDTINDLPFTLTNLSSAVKGGASSTTDPERSAKLAKIREWANANGIDVSERGRIAADVEKAYDKAHN